MNILGKLLSISAAIGLAACSSTSSGGVVLGVKGSPYWNKFAPANDVVAYYDGQRDYELCSTWAKAYQEPLVRRHIADALKRRGQPEDKCYSPELDALKEAEDAAAPRSRYVPPAQPRRTMCTSSNIGNMVQTYCN